LPRVDQDRRFGSASRTQCGSSTRNSDLEPVSQASDPIRPMGTSRSNTTYFSIVAGYTPVGGERWRYHRPCRISCWGTPEASIHNVPGRRPGPGTLDQQWWQWVTWSLQRARLRCRRQRAVPWRGHRPGPRRRLRPLIGESAPFSCGLARQVHENGAQTAIMCAAHHCDLGI
jgi:hypothetical protein